MYFAYKSQDIQPEKVHQSNKKNSVKRIPDVQTYNDVRILYRAPCSNSNDCIQMFKLMPYTYAGETYSWDKEKEIIIKEAIERAKKHLKKALNDSSIIKIVELHEAIKQVLEVFENSDLEIYPLISDESHGEAQCGSLAISINIDKLYKKIRILTKTLIHEAFHIIGGCIGKEDDSYDDDSSDNDIPCDNGMSKRDALEKIKDCSKAQMVADIFAQFVITC